MTKHTGGSKQAALVRGIAQAEHMPRFGSDEVR